MKMPKLRSTIRIGAILIGLILGSPVAAQYAKNSSSSRSNRQVELPLGIPESLWRKRIPKDNTISSLKLALGASLYFDKRLSIDGTVSCASCHDPALAFTDSKALSVGVAGKMGTRNAPTVLNAMFIDALFWDGRSTSLEQQAKHPLTSPSEMGSQSTAEVVARVSAIPEYRRKFNRIFKPQGITLETIAKAIATYERTLLSGNSPFDQFMSGDKTAISDAQRRGWELFKGKAKCIDCHSYAQISPFFTDSTFHNTGVAASDILFQNLTQQIKYGNNSA
jgi:cytochrome c peroxidase